MPSKAATDSTAMATPHSSSLDPRFQLVIFDFDGTLANTEAWFMGIANDVARLFGFKEVNDEEEIAALRGMTSKEVIKYLGIPGWKLPRIARHIHSELAANIGAVELFPGIAHTIETLSDHGVRLAIVSSNTEANVRGILGPDLVERFECFECGASLFGKARRYRAVRKGAGLKKRDVLAIGDETRDIIAAHKEDIACAGVLWGSASRTALENVAPDVLFETPEAVVATVLGRNAVRPAG